MPPHRSRAPRRRPCLGAAVLPLAVAGAVTGPVASGQDTMAFAGRVPAVGATVGAPAAAPGAAATAPLPTTEAPEPASMTLLASGVVALVGAVWLRKEAVER